MTATCGVCVTPPEDRMMDRLRRTPCANLTGTREYCDTMNPPTAPNLSCYTNFDPASPPPLATTQMDSVWGVVDVFGTGGNSDMIRVQIFNINADGTPGTMLGEATAMTSVAYHEEEDELNTQGMVTQHRLLGGFVIPNIPTERPVLVRTQGPADFFGHAIYDYTLAIRNDAVNMPMPPPETMITGAAVKIRPRTISNSDWVTIPSTSTLPTGIPAGRGAIAGEVHDCDDVRLSNAVVYANPAPRFEPTVYFSDNDTNPLPDTSRSTHGTQLLGIYAMLDLAPGPLRISALGYDGSGALVHVGSYEARIFADSVTVVTIRGLRPWQVMH
jgi:hypothetical protein